MVDHYRTLVGRVFEATNPIRVSADMIADFCAAIGEQNPLYTDVDPATHGPGHEMVAPPAFAATFRDGDNVWHQITRLGGGGLAAGTDIEFVTPIRAGDLITIGSSIKDIYEKTGRSGPMVFSVIRSTLKNQRGEVVAYIDHRFMNRPDVVGSSKE